MISFKTFLIEQSDEIPDEIFTIVRECKPVIDASGGPANYTLYRGMKSSNIFQLKDVRESRRPLDISNKVHHAMDQWFKDRTGVNFRSNAIMTTSDRKTARLYGNIHLVFPVGTFKFMWSPNAADIGSYVYDRISPSEEKGDVTERVEEILNQAEFKSGKFTDAVASGNEIMIHCQQYWSINLQEVDQQTIIDMLSQAYTLVHG